LEFWLRFGSVTGFFKPTPSPKPRQNFKILAPHGYSFSSNALAYTYAVANWHNLRIRQDSKSVFLAQKLSDELSDDGGESNELQVITMITPCLRFILAVQNRGCDH
jgi:hypothetical protein